MPKSASSATRVNRVFSLLVVLSFIVAGFVKQSSAPSETAPTTPKRSDVTDTAIQAADGTDWGFESNMDTGPFEFSGESKSSSCRTKT